MRLACIQTAGGPVPVTWKDERWCAVDSLFSDGRRLSGRSWPVTAPLSAPVRPGVVVGMSANSSPEGRQRAPRAFLKSVRTVVAPGDPIVIDRALGRHVAEGELAVIIGRDARNVPEARALDVVLGYAIANDVTATDQIPLDPTFTQGKNGDGFTPLGPWIETAFEPADAAIGVWVDGALMASGSTAELARTVAEQIAFVTSYMRLAPGDVLLTGCPGTAAEIRPGERVSIEIDGLGALTNDAVHAGSAAPQRQETT